MTDGWVDRNPWQLDEVAYLKHLGEERHMFAWCMSKYGGLAPEAARAAEKGGQVHFLRDSE